MVRQVHHQDLHAMIKKYFWWVPEKEIASLSHDAIVESVLSNGNEGTVSQLFDYYGIEKVAEIFNRQTSGRRFNYRPRTINFFRLYFKRHAQHSGKESCSQIF
jgi:beta-galactosidase GanA